MCWLISPSAFRLQSRHRQISPYFCLPSVLKKVIIILLVCFTYHKSQRFLRIQSDSEKPHFIIGILSSDYYAYRRDTLRNTWISTIERLKDQLPLRITYKFLLDKESEISYYENFVYGDIVYLNISHHGYAYKYSEKLYTWLKYIHKNYPNALLGAKMDDDVFLCVPQMINRLYELRHPKLYYGWRHQLRVPPHFDEMFVVLGRDLIKRIAERTYCGKEICDNSNELIERGCADLALLAWLSIYNDTVEQEDNNIIIHGWTYFHHLINKASCSSYLLFHKSAPEIIYKLFYATKHTLETSNRLPSEKDFEAGNLSLIFRSGARDEFKRIVAYRTKSIYVGAKDRENVGKNWAIVRTILPASNAIKHMSKKPNWCLLIVADVKTPPEHMFLKDITGTCVKYLSVKEQQIWFPLLSDSIPYSHFGRKNIGYMYAIYNKAKLIWDFDDNHVGIIDPSDIDIENSDSYVTVCNYTRNTLVNPYSYFSASKTRTWQRGFPLQQISDNKTVPKICKLNEKVKIGILQSLANKHPDVDAMYRFTHTNMFNFTASKKTHKPLAIPINSYSPFNARATMWRLSSFYLLALPISVNERISDIWRSYAAQYFMHKNSYQLAFVHPYVIQERYSNSVIEDFNSEIDLYVKSKHLVDFLGNPEARNFQNMTELYEELYLKKYIDVSDLYFIYAWEMTLAYIKEKRA